MAIWEGAAIKAFSRHVRSYLPASQLVCLDTILGTLALMQHYGAPTRLLDWTFSAWVAAYFAAAASPEEDGVIWGFNRDKLSRDTKWGIESGDADTLQRFDQLTGATTVHAWAAVSSIAIPAFSSYIDDFADQRMSSQQSLFTISGTLGERHDERLASILPDNDRFQIIIPAALKRGVIDRLLRLNVHAMSLFPSIDGVGRYMTDIIHNQLNMDDGGVGWVLRATDDGRDIVGNRQRKPRAPKARSTNKKRKA